MTSNAIRQEQRRRFSRIFFDASATLECGTGRCEAQLLDISLRGALLGIRGDIALLPGSVCQFELCLGEHDERISMTAEIAHMENVPGLRRIGIHCREMDLDSITHLRRLVELNLGNDDLLHRELAALTAPETDGPAA